MIVVKVPLRISLFGGGTDFPEFYEKHGTTIVSFAIQQYMHLVWNPRPTGGYRLSYSEVEEVGSLTEVKHTLVRVFARRYKLDDPCTMTIISDVPKGTGLGSSSALSVALSLLGEADRANGRNLAWASYATECEVTGCGVQDHLPAAFGSFRVYSFSEPGYIAMRTAPHSLRAMIEENGVLLYTRLTRRAQDVLPNWKDESTLLKLKGIADLVRHRFTDMTYDYLVDSLKETWSIKASIPGVVSDSLLAQFELARSLGADAGKLLGAGAGGCWFFLVPPDRQRSFVDGMGLPRIPLKIAPFGARKYDL